MPVGIFHPNLHLYNQDTLYDWLDTAREKKGWAIYYGDVPQSLTMTYLCDHPTQFEFSR